MLQQTEYYLCFTEMFRAVPRKITFHVANKFYSTISWQELRFLHGAFISLFYTTKRLQQDE